jgi:short-subunit dehydrogenase
LLAQPEGHVLNTASAASFEALPGMGPYGASKHAVLGISEALRRELTASGSRVGVSVLIPGGVVKSDIMSSARNWPPMLGPEPAPDADPLPTLVRTMFTQAIDGGVDPHIVAQAAIKGIRNDTFAVCDAPDLLAQWGAHHAAVARGEPPTWPPR